MSESGPPIRRRETSSPDFGSSGWKEWEQHVLNSLDRLDKSNEQQNKVLQAIQISMAVLTTKVSLYAAGIAVVVTGAVEILVRLIGK